MPLKKVAQKYYQQARCVNKINWSFLILTIIFVVNLTSNSSAQIAEKKVNPTENVLSNIGDITNKADDKQAAETAKQDKTTQNHDINSISKIVSSLVGKKRNNQSLMFSVEEVEKIEEAINAHANNQPFNTETKVADKEEEVSTAGEVNSCIYLGSIIYHSPNSWAAWVNGEKITNSNNKSSNEIYIKSINSDSADLVWKMSISKWKILSEQKSESGAPISADNQVELKFNLSFNQSYMLNGGKIIEGRISSSPTWGHSKTLINAIKNNQLEKQQSSPTK